MITDEQIARVFNKHGANFFAGARELIALAQQEPAHDEVPMPQNADQAQLMALLAENWLKHNAPERLKEPAQAVPYGWHVTGMSCLMVGEYAEHDAKAAAKRCGGTTKAIPLYTHPSPLDSDTRRLVLELCAQVIRNSGEYEHIPGTVEAMAADIIERLEAGE